MKKYIVNRFNSYLKHHRDIIIEETIRSMTIQHLQDINLNSSVSIVNEKDNNLIVSLTTFGRRINEVYLAIESIGLQTLKAKKIILWLAEDEFNDENLPISLKNLKKRGLSIEYCQDIKAYKKLIPALEKYGNNLILTIDDDCIYQRDLVEKLFFNYLEKPDVIHCGAAKIMELKNNLFTPYNNWKQNVEQSFIESKTNFSIGFSGVLYFPNCFHEDIFDQHKFMKLSPHADDIWFKAMSLLKGVKVKSIGNQFSKSSSLIPIEKAQQDSLSMINIGEQKNDEQLRNVFEAYDAYKLLK